MHLEDLLAAFLFCKLQSIHPRIDFELDSSSFLTYLSLVYCSNQPTLICTAVSFLY